MSILSDLDINSALTIKKNTKNDEVGDRFIPNKVRANLFDLYFAQDDQNRDKTNLSKTGVLKEKQSLSDLLQQQLFDDTDFAPRYGKAGSSSKKQKANKIIKFGSENKTKTLAEKEIYKHTEQIQENRQQKYRKKIVKQPTKILDAPGLQDDYYLNLMDWSKSNQLAIGLDSMVYLWSATSSKVTKLCEYEQEKICSVSWSEAGSHIAVGNSSGEVELFDMVKQRSIRVFEGHSSRVGSLDWNGNVLASGSRDMSILLRDPRDNKDYFSTLYGPSQEVCGLKWSPDNNTLASGGNDNKLFLWSLKEQKEIKRFHEHTAAVKAIGWSPTKHNVLASGGGTADRCLRFWDTQTLEMTSCIDTGSQVCNLMFSKNSDELVTTHGFSLNQIIVWDLPSMEKIATLTGHSYRVLFLSMSPCAQTIVTGAGDETLRFWNIFPPSKSNNMFYNGVNSSLTMVPGLR